MDRKKLNKIKEAYGIITDEEKRKQLSIENRINLISFLEEETGMVFNSTDDFIRKMKSYIIKHSQSSGRLLKEVREKKGLSQYTMSILFDVTQQYISQLERCRKPLNKKALQFIAENI